jgi:outer membrane immunogenic protein
VIGAQFMFNWTDIDASRVSVLFPANTIHAKMRGFGTLTGRLGYAFTPSFLFYGKFGWGVYGTDFTVANTVTGVELASTNRRQSGFDLGVGGEWMISPNWSLWIEWDHIFAQDKSFFFPNLGPVGTTAEVSRGLDKVLVGFNWRFGGAAAPVAARY